MFFVRQVRAIYIDGDLDLGGEYKVTNMATTTDDSDAATIEYVKSAVIGGETGVGSWILNGTDLYPRETTWDVGIGTTEPQAKLEVYDTGDSLTKIKTDGYIEVDGGIIPMTTGVGNIGTDTNRWGDIRMSGTLYDGGTTYYIDPNDTGTSAVFAGNVGIGTTSPTAKLDVRGGHLNVSDSTFQNPGGWGSTIYLDNGSHSRILINERSTGVQSSLWAHTGGNAKVGTVSAHNFDIMTGGNAKISIIHSTGNVGIGTTVPDKLLHVYTNTATEVDVAKFQNTNTSGYVGVQIDRASSARYALLKYSTAGTNDWYVGTPYQGGSEYVIGKGISLANALVTVQGDGNVGIGTTSPSHKLHIEKTLSGDGIVPFIHLDPNSTTNGDGAAIDFRASNADNANTYISRIAGGRESSGGLSDLRFSTYGADGLNERVRILANGNIGIGTTSPETRLHIRGHGTAASITSEEYGGVGSGSLRLKGLRGTAGNTDVGRIQAYWDGNNIAEIRMSSGDDTTNKDDGHMYFMTSESASTVQTRMTIEPNGNVGIGVTSPIYALEVAGTNQSFTLTDSNDSYAEIAQLDHSDGNGGNLSLWNDAGTKNVLIRSYGVSYFNGGNVGIGTTSPTAGLHITDSSTDTTPNIAGVQITGGGDWASMELTGASGGYIDFQNDVNGTDYDMRIRLTGNDILSVEGGDLNVVGSVTLTNNGTVGAGSSKWTFDDTNDDISTFGNVGIGLLAPSELLHIKDTTAGEKISIRIHARNTADTSDPSGYIVFDPDADFIALSQTVDNASAGIGVAPNGNVGINDTTPSYKLDVNGTGRFTGNVTMDAHLYMGATGSSSRRIYGNYFTGQAGDNVHIDAPSGQSMYLNYYAGNSIIFGNSDGFVDASGNMQLDGTLSVDGAGNSYINGNVGIGTTSPAASLDVQGDVYLYGGSGDISNNTTIGIEDIIAWSNYLNEVNMLSVAEFARGDVNGDGKVSWDDGWMIAQLNGLTVGTPAHKTAKEIAERKVNMLYGPYTDSSFFVNGNIGIGVYTPQNKLDVEGGAVIGATYSGTNTAPSNGLLVEGNVGIGTTVPQASLHVWNGQAMTSNNTGGYLVPTADQHLTPKKYVDELVVAGGADGYINDPQSHTAGGDLNMAEKLILNIGNAGTDFTSNGGLTLAGTFDPNGSITLPTTGITGAGSGSGLDADLLDGISSASFLRSDTTDYFTSTIYFRGDLVGGDDGYRDHGVYGNYDSYKTDTIWSMGTGYRNAADGSNFGNLYGLAYKHTNNTTGGTMAGGHQMVWAQNGTGTAAMGSGLWTSGAITGATLDTGQGANELYDMNQNVLTTSSPTFATVNTGQGANELYGMNQNVLTSSSPTFATLSVTGKLTAGEIDPPYNIDGTIYATYGHSTTGLKEETVGKLRLQEARSKKQETKLYIAEIDFDEAKKESDLWLFKEITAFGDDWNDLVVSLTPEGKANIWYEFIPEENKLIIYGNQPVKVSYRLMAPRFDWPERDTNLYNQTGEAGEGVGIFVR